MTELRGGKSQILWFDLACKPQNSQDVLKILFLFPADHNNYKSLCGLQPQFKPVADFVWIFTHKWVIIIMKAFNMKYLILKSFIRQKSSGNSASSRPDSHFTKPDQELSVCLIYSSITGVPRPCVNIVINVQRAKRHLNILLFGHSQLWFHSCKPPSSLVSVQFAESGSLLFRRDYQTSLSCLLTDPLPSTMPRFGSAWPQGAPVHPCNQSQNWLCTALEATWATPKLLKGILLAALLCCFCGGWKNPQRCWAPALLRLLHCKLWHCPPRLWLNTPTTASFSPACLGTIGSLITSKS